MLATVDTLQDCQAACIQNTSCLALDFDVSKRCYIHTNPAWETNIIEDKPNVDQWLLSRLCQGSSSITSLPTSRSCFIFDPCCGLLILHLMWPNISDMGDILFFLNGVGVSPNIIEFSYSVSFFSIFSHLVNCLFIITWISHIHTGLFCAVSLLGFFSYLINLSISFII